MIELIVQVLDHNIMEVNDIFPLIIEKHLEILNETIKDKVVVMGHNTYKSLGEPNTALLETAKEIVVMSRTMIFPKPIKVCRTISELLKRYPDFIVIGGESLFSDIIMLADKVYVTEVSQMAEFGSYKYFPKMNNFKLTNPNAEFLHEGDNYFRLLTYSRR